jgi:ribosome-binding factor A
MQHRDIRVAAAIREAVADIILTKLNDPAVGFVSVTRCRVSKDLRIATMHITAPGDAKRKAAALEHVRRASGLIRRRLAERVKLRCLPELRFFNDDILDQEQHVGEILHDLFPDRPAQPEPAERAETEAAENDD